MGSRPLSILGYVLLGVSVASANGTNSTYSDHHLMPGVCDHWVNTTSNVLDRSGNKYVANLRATHAPVVSAEAPSRSAAKRAKRGIDAAAYDAWRSLDDPVLSPNGKWVAYTLSTGNGATELVVRSTSSDKEMRMRSDVLAQNERSARIKRVSPTFTADSRHVVFATHTQSIEPSGGAPVRGHPRSERAGRYDLTLVALSSGRSETIHGVEDFALDKSTSSHLAYTISSEVGKGAGIEQQAAGSKTLVVKDIDTGLELSVTDVTQYSLNKTGRYIAYVVATSNPSDRGVFVRDLKTGVETALARGAGEYLGVTFDHQGRQLAFLSNGADTDSGIRRMSIYYAPAPTSPARLALAAESLLPRLQIAPEYGIRFTEEDDALVFGVFPPAAPTLNDKSRETSNINVEIWRGDDLRIQPQLQGNIRPVRPGAYLSLYHIDARRWTQLATDRVPWVMLPRAGRYALGIDQAPYKIGETWSESIADLYAIDTQTGAASIIRKAFRTSSWLPYSPFLVSPTGTYVLLFEHRRWFSYNFHTQRLIDLTGKLLPSVLFDAPPRNYATCPESPVGVAGWLPDGRHVLIYDRFNIWDVDASGVDSPTNLTNGLANDVFRVWPHAANVGAGVVPLSEGNRTLRIDRPLFLTYFNQHSMRSGVSLLRLQPIEKPSKPFTLDRQINLVDVRYPSQFLATIESFTEFPDLWVGPSLDHLKQISNANPQQSEYRWGAVEVVDWVTELGVPVRGLLYKPDDYVTGKKLPLIVDIFGTWSQSLHTYFPPEPSAAALSLMTLLSNDYLVFRPDLATIRGSLVDGVVSSVIPGISTLIDKGVVDPNQIAVMGHSEGGYKVNLLITRTDMFRCAIEIAGVTDAFSDYGSLRIGGTARSDRYDYRNFYGSPWQEPAKYLENSPVFFASRVKTPLLILHNSKDPAVPFSQAVEWYIGLRRNRAEVYLVNYRDEGHELRRRANQLDWELRALQFLNQCMGRDAKPRWMTADSDPVEAYIQQVSKNVESMANQ
jgi:dipeptidyl aminopeptidase/acylaminoacyl peptidase